jgi:DUF4097 and DUF4098 domain-containing protein YvlB
MPTYHHPGPLGVRLDLVAGDARVTASARGDVVVEVVPRDPGSDDDVRAAGAADVALEGDRLELGPVAGAAVLTTGSGPIAVGPVGSVVAKTASGAIRVDRITAGDADLRTAAGDIEIGIAEGSAAHLDVRAHRGTVLQQLEPLAGPPREGPRVSVRARTGTGDVVVRRA